MILIHLEFGYKTLTEELSWATMVLLPKRKGYHQGIGLVEVAWKVCVLVVNDRSKQSFELDDVIHRSERGG